MERTFPMNKHNVKRQSGQILLIAILLASIILTVGLSITKLTSEETKSSKLTEDQQRAFAAAEAGIDAAINAGDDVIGQDFIGLFSEGSDISGEARYITTTSDRFTTPLISKDGQYTFYITGYNPTTKQVIEGPFQDDVVINRASPTGSYCGTSNEFAVELTFINVNDGIVGRRLIDEECNMIDGTTTDEINFGDTIQTSLFPSDPHIMVARILNTDNNFNGAKLEVVNATGNQWPLQGRTIRSTAQTAGKVTKKIELFQSYPQFFSEFFVTSF